MKKLMLRIEIEVVDMERADAIKESIETWVGNLPEDSTINVRYEERPD